MTAKEKKTQEITMFGIRLEELVAAAFKFPGSKRLLAMNILSDSQEQMEKGSNELSRQAINRAKWVIAEYLTERR